ncbi:MAG: hypothetical protein ACI90V_013043, partial [Bacillariaceae sp.]
MASYAHTFARLEACKEQKQHIKHQRHKKAQQT